MPSLSLSCPSFGLCGLFLVVGPLLEIFLVVVVVIILAMLAAFGWLLICVRRLALPQLRWCGLLLRRHHAQWFGQGAVVGWVEGGQMWWEGGGWKTKGTT